ncbi:MAG: hypothetical protein CM1200mP2_49430 [Planctomycetaceae bacterium]|nr:MAG: hypothetical protein CM1200mP2_49430 [Planctomycetaceae bacterium]
MDFPGVAWGPEEIRDSLLFVAGLLDTTMHGTLLSLKPRQYVNDAKTGKHLFGYDNLRRSVYQPVIRNKVYSLFQTFEFPSPSLVAGRRATTTVPPQMLVMMNSDLVARCSRGMAGRVLRNSAPPSRTKSGWAHETVFGRSPDAGELQRAGRFLDAFAQTLPADLGQIPKGNVKCGRRSARP